MASNHYLPRSVFRGAAIPSLHIRTEHQYLALRCWLRASPTSASPVLFEEVWPALFIGLHCACRSPPRRDVITRKRGTNSGQDESSLRWRNDGSRGVCNLFLGVEMLGSPDDDEERPERCGG